MALLREHREYKDHVVEYQAIDVEGAPLSLHGSPKRAGNLMAAIHANP